MRSKLFVPGSRPELFEKAIASEADALSFDLEDAVAPGKKIEARTNLKNFLRSPLASEQRKIIIIRVNAMDSPYFKDDIDAVVQAGVHSINLPKPESVQDVLDCVLAIEAAEEKNRLTLQANKKIKLLLNIETAKALRIAAQLAQAHPRVCGLQLGLADLFEPLAISRQSAFAIQFAMMQVKFAAGEAGVDAFDAAYADIKNKEGFLAEARLAASFGYKGKTCIHPSQIEMANEAFKPDSMAIAHAMKVVQAAAIADTQGLGAYVVDGKMIDPPFVKSAQALVAYARDLGLIK
jgi:citrate lyase subunit beta/citryl-CoA lyase